MVHVAAARMLGEFVSRGPWTSVKYQSVSMTWDRWRPSSLIRYTASRSTRSEPPAGAWAQAAAASMVRTSAVATGAAAGSVFST